MRISDWSSDVCSSDLALNENFDAQSWGLELEAAWRPSRNFRIDSNFGYLRTRIGKGAQSIDVMDRTQGNEDWVVLRPQLGVPSNCIAPQDKVEPIRNSFFEIEQASWRERLGPYV